MNLKLKKAFYILFIIISINGTLAAGVMSTPRRVSVLKLEHFDIIYPEVSEKTAIYLADNLESLYKTAKEKLPLAQDLHIPVVISPDSDGLSVKYTSSPYNRIVCFDSVPEKDSFFHDTLLGLFYHEIYLALSQSIRSPINQFIYKTIGGDSYQPISLIYLPYTFVQGRAHVEDGRLNDKAFLEILSIAKYEDQFPNWLQASTAKDIYPGTKLTEAAGAAFSAYLMQTYGIDKYIEFWNQCGELNFRLTSGLFKKVYNITLNELWKGFEDSVPLPPQEIIEEMKALDEKTEKLFPYDTEGLFENILVTEYGIVWYDNIRHEVDILDFNSPIKMRKLLFMATDVKKLTLAPNGRYIVVSFYGRKIRDHFRDDKVWIYDLQQRKFIDVKFNVRDGAIITNIENYKENQILVGIDVKDKISKIKVFNFKYTEKLYRLIDEITFPRNKNPYSLTYAGEENVIFLMEENNISTMYKLNIKNMALKKWQFLYKGSDVNIRNITYIPSGKKKENTGPHYYTFEYYPENEFSFSRMGIIKLNEKYEPEKVYFQDKDIAGGVHYPFITGKTLYFVADRLNHSDIEILPLSELSLCEGEIRSLSAEQPETDTEEYRYTEIEKQPEQQLNYEIEKYNPFRYMMSFSFSPFKAIKELTTTEKQELWPSLGATITTQDDPFMNNKIMISAAGAYAPLDFITTVNPTQEELYEYEKQHIDDKKNISAGIIIENTSTPVNIKAGCLFKANTSGQYNFTTILNGLWKLPMGMSFSKFIISLNTFYTASTDYYDVSLKEIFPAKSNWPGFRDAYESSKLWLALEYTNIHQYGVSKYENIGFAIGLYLDSFWDITEIRALKQKLGKDDPKFPLTEAQRKKMFAENLLEMSQLNMGLFTDIKIPKLTPFNMYKGLVFSMPSTVKAEVLVEPGTALHVNTETLLLGWECQNGFPFMYTYFSRIGLKAGYDLRLKYDTSKVPLPDFRRKESWWNVFSNAYVQDSVFFIYDMDFLLAVGRLSQSNMNLTLKAEYFIRTKGFSFTFNFNIDF